MERIITDRFNKKDFKLVVIDEDLFDKKYLKYRNHLNVLGVNNKEGQYLDIHDDENILYIIGYIKTSQKNEYLIRINISINLSDNSEKIFINDPGVFTDLIFHSYSKKNFISRVKTPIKPIIRTFNLNIIKDFENNDIYLIVKDTDHNKISNDDNNYDNDFTKHDNNIKNVTIKEVKKEIIEFFILYKNVYEEIYKSALPIIKSKYSKLINFIKKYW